MHPIKKPRKIAPHCNFPHGHLLCCRDPVIAAGGVGGAVLAGVALVDWHYALRYVGVLGTQLTLFNWLTSYDSPQVALHNILISCNQAEHVS